MSLAIAHAAVRRGRRAVLEPGYIVAAAPAAVAVVGINGSGKSSLFMHLAGTLLKSRGPASITVGGRAATLTYVPQEPAFPAWLRVQHVAGMYGLDLERLIEDMPGMHLHELSGERAGTLSLGQRQALAIALALARRSDLTLLDEPFSALDFRRRIGAVELLRQQRDAGRSILLSSQSAADLAELCDRFVVIRDGRYAFNGSRSELVANGHSVERRLLQLLT